MVFFTQSGLGINIYNGKEWGDRQTHVKMKIEQAQTARLP